MVTAETLKAAFEQGLPYPEYVATGDADKQAKWAAFLEQVHLTDAQRETVGGFVRELNVLIISGVWCGDCVQQCPMAHRIADASRTVNLRLVDRDEHMDLAERFTICGGTRVPVILFLNEDYDLLSFWGDRSLARYRAMAARNLGPACPLPGAPVPADEIAATLADWVDEFERAHLIARLSTKLRHRHGD